MPDDLDADARVALAKQLARLPCAIARHLDSLCPANHLRIPLTVIPTGLRAAMVLLTGTNKEVTPAVHHAVYDALVRVVRHHSSGFGIAITGPMFEVALKGVKGNDRSARLSAGYVSVYSAAVCNLISRCSRCVSELVKMLQDKGAQGTQQIETMFKNMDVILSRCPDRVKETTLVSIGLIARCVYSPIRLSYAHSEQASKPQDPVPLTRRPDISAR